MTDPVHIGDDPNCSILDWSSRLAYQVPPPGKVLDPDMNPEDRKLAIFQAEAVQARRDWEASHPNEPFAGVFLNPKT